MAIAFPDREVSDHAKWARTERERLARSLSEFEDERDWIGRHIKGEPAGPATLAHMDYLRVSIAALDRVIAACETPVPLRVRQPARRSPFRAHHH